MPAKSLYLRLLRKHEDGDFQKSSDFEFHGFENRLKLTTKDLNTVKCVIHH